MQHSPLGKNASKQNNAMCRPAIAQFYSSACGTINFLCAFIALTVASCPDGKFTESPEISVRVYNAMYIRDCVRRPKSHVTNVSRMRMRTPAQCICMYCVCVLVTRTCTSPSLTEAIVVMIIDYVQCHVHCIYFILACFNITGIRDRHTNKEKYTRLTFLLSKNHIC